MQAAVPLFLNVHLPYQLPAPILKSTVLSRLALRQGAAAVPAVELVLDSDDPQAAVPTADAAAARKVAQKRTG